MVRRQEERRVKVAGTHEIADRKFQLSGISEKSREKGHALPLRCLTVKSFHLLSHGYQPLSHASPLISLLVPSHLFIVNCHFDPSQLR